MSAKQSRLFRKLAAHTGSSQSRRLKRKWNSTPRNERGLIAEGIRNTIANLEKGIVPPADSA